MISSQIAKEIKELICLYSIKCFKNSKSWLAAVVAEIDENHAY